MRQLLVPNVAGLGRRLRRAAVLFTTWGALALTTGCGPSAGPPTNGADAGHDVLVDHVVAVADTGQHNDLSPDTDNPDGSGAADGASPDTGPNGDSGRDASAADAPTEAPTDSGANASADGNIEAGHADAAIDAAGLEATPATDAGAESADTAGGGGADAPMDASLADHPSSSDAAAPDGALLGSGEADIVFLVDDSSSMAPLQGKLGQSFSTFINTLESLPGGLPSLHISVVSSSLGAGLYTNVPGCAPGTAGNHNGSFMHPAACTALPASEHFLISDRGIKNFTGDISDVFSCVAQLGSQGCGFEHQFAATQLALQRAGVPSDPENAGFLRPEAHLAVIMLTNEDDCSAPVDSTLFDPAQQSVNDPVGQLSSYRCNEFGHLCDGHPPPRNATAGVSIALNNCTSAESNGRLTLVADFISFLRSLKADPNMIFVAALAGPPTPYVVNAQNYTLATGAMEYGPVMQHSCTSTTGDYADPAVRVKMWIDAFAPHAAFESVCPDDLSPAMTRIAQALASAIRP